MAERDTLRGEAGRVTILGDGGWGTSLAALLARKGVAVTMWGAFPEYLEEMRTSRVNRKFLPGVELPEELAFEPDARKAAEGADLITVAIPTRYMHSTLSRIKGDLPQDVPYVSVAKGLFMAADLAGQAVPGGKRLLRGTEIVRDCLGDVRVGGLFGPSHAEEVAKGLPTAVVATAADPDLAQSIQATFLTSLFRVYTSDDLVGVEIAGAVKNVIAIATGICDGLGFGDNSKAALLTRGLAEMTRLGVSLGARARTFIGLAGVGDLVTTCYSPFGRNRAVGVRIGKGMTLAEAEGSTEMVAEGVTTAPAILELARRGVEMPIAAEVCAILFENKDPRQAVADLMTRPPKAEGEGF